jgi:hypothetical protein
VAADAVITIDWVKLGALIGGTILGSGGLVVLWFKYRFNRQIEDVRRENEKAIIEHRSQLQRESDLHKDRLSLYVEMLNFCHQLWVGNCSLKASELPEFSKYRAYTRLLSSKEAQTAYSRFVDAYEKLAQWRRAPAQHQNQVEGQRGHAELQQAFMVLSQAMERDLSDGVAGR